MSALSWLMDLDFAGSPVPMGLESGYTLNGSRMRRLQLLGVLDDGQQEEARRYTRNQGRPWWTRQPAGR